jgi:hypothetical protein
MARYQIRTRDEKQIEDVIDEMAINAWQVLKAWEVFQGIHENSYQPFRHALKIAVAPYLHTYKLCGLSNICLDGVIAGPWASDAHSLEACPWDLVYHLFPKPGLEEFLTEITFNAVNSIRHLLKPDTEEGVTSSVRVVFRCILANYLFENPICGKTELCVYSSMAPLNTWNRAHISKEYLN